MSIQDYIEVFKRLDGLIRRKNTGTPKELAEKLKLSERQVHRLIKIYKNYYPIEFSKSRRSYCYYISGRARIMEFVSDEIDVEVKNDGRYHHQSSK